jgi:hypothetical protein
MAAIRTARSVGNYDPSVLQSQAERLYWRASRLLAERTVLWALLGFAGTFVSLSLLQSIGDVSPVGGSFVGGALLGWLGYRSAAEEAFRLRLEAQTALCQVQIERNTSRGDDRP